VLAVRWPATRVVLLDARAARTSFLTEAVAELGIGGRVEVRTGRAEELGRDPALRTSFDAVVARSFGPPAVTAECGAPFLRVGGLLVVAEPPGGDPARWPAVGLAGLGLVDAGLVTVGEATARRLRVESACGDGFPRANGVPAGRPLF
jgi:16S rRNA (guanine527-N7)-methyltransferase